MNIILPLLFLFTFQHVPYRTLTWEDFRGTVPKSGMSSTTTTAIELTTAGEDGRYIFSINAYFDPNASWARVKDSATLIHENLHFALTYIWARRIEKALERYQGTGMRAAAEATYDHLIQEWNRSEKDYDLETNHSRDISQQHIWERKIQKLLND